MLRPSSRRSSRSKRSSRSTRSSSNSKSSTKLKLLEEKAKIAELKAEATFVMEKQKAEQQAKMLQIQGEVARAKARARVYEDYTHIQSRASTTDEAEYDEIIELKSINRRQKLTIVIEELDNRSCDQLAMCDKINELVNQNHAKEANSQNRR